MYTAAPFENGVWLVASLLQLSIIINYCDLRDLIKGTAHTLNRLMKKSYCMTTVEHSIVQLLNWQVDIQK